MRTARLRQTLLSLTVALLACGAEGCKKKRSGITLGLYASTTGQQAAFGIATRNGVQLAIDEANAHGGVLNEQVRYVEADTRGDAAEAANAVTRLIDREGVTGLLGEIASGLSMSGGRIAQRRRVPMITPSSTAETVTEIGDYVFRVCFIDPFQGAVMARFAHNELHVNQVAIFKNQSSPYSTGLADAFRKTFTELGGQIVDEQSYRTEDTHFSAQLGSLTAKHPQAIYIPGYYNEVVLIGRELRGMDYTAPLLGGDGWDAPELWQGDNDKLVGCYLTESFSADHAITPRGAEFVTNYKNKYHTDANGLAALGYDAALVMMDALTRAGSVEPQKLRDAIAQTRGFVGATGTITLDARRNAVKSAVILEVRENGFQFHAAVDPPSAQ